MIKVLIADGSAAVCALLNQIITEDSRFDVAGIAHSGEQAASMALENNPDLVIIDGSIPKTNCLETTKKIHSTSRIPVIIYTSEDSADSGYQYIENGALDVMEKPAFSSMTAESLKVFCNKLFEIAGHVLSKPQTFRAEPEKPAPVSIIKDVKDNKKADTKVIVQPERKDYRLLLIGASTGGPAAIQTVLEGLGSNFPLPILITQHIDNLFDSHFAKWLDETTGIRVEIARSGTIVQKGKAYLAPANVHMELKKSGKESYEILLTDDPPVHFLKPAVDKLFISAAKAGGKEIISVLLTGMGKDGADGTMEIKKSGGYTIAEEESSCIVYGMPKAAVENGSAMAIIPLEDISKFIYDRLLPKVS